MAALRTAALAFAAISLVNGSPCPFGQMAERGELSEENAAKFYAARTDGESVVKTMMSEHAEASSHKQKRAFAAQEAFYNEQKAKRQLNLGGGLLSGVLQPFSGILEGLDVPTPQKFGLALVPSPEHPYKAPGPTDVRGMCPTMNTMANHGYVDRSGITTFAQAANACQITLGFGYDTCVFLSALGLLSGGDLVTGKYSIGGQDDRVPNTLGPALGISAHGPFEIDQSMTRIDLYHGNQASFSLDRWNAIVEDSKMFGNQFGLDLWNHERQRTYSESKTTNPNFDAGVKQLAVSLAERVFIPRAMSNGTNPDVADYANVAPFYLNETFPDNWFRRATPYDLPNVGTDVAALFLMGPTEIGHNEGTGNFIPLGADLSDLEDGTGVCFLYQSFMSLTPGQIAPVFKESYDVVAQFLNGAVKPFFANAGCQGLTMDTAADGYAAPGVSAPSAQLMNGRYVAAK